MASIRTEKYLINTWVNSVVIISDNGCIIENDVYDPDHMVYYCVSYTYHEFVRQGHHYGYFQVVTDGETYFRCKTDHRGQYGPMGADHIDYRIYPHPTLEAAINHAIMEHLNYNNP
jgi:hypothetical protein